MKKFLKSFILFFILTNFVMAEEIKVFEFTEEEFDTFEVKKVRGADANTKYSLGSNKNGNFFRFIGFAIFNLN